MGAECTAEDSFGNFIHNTCLKRRSSHECLIFQHPRKMFLPNKSFDQNENESSGVSQLYHECVIQNSENDTSEDEEMNLGWKKMCSICCDDSRHFMDLFYSQFSFINWSLTSSWQ